MATSYPTSVDSFTDPTTTDPMNSPSHAGEHTDANDAINAIETQVGTTGAFNFLQTAGGTMSGAVAMGSNKITGLANGTASGDAAAFGQIPTAVDGNLTVGGKAVSATSGLATNDVLQYNGTDWVSAAAPSSPGGLAIYGDGSDGSPTFDGTTTILGIVPNPNSAVDGVYTLARDIFLASPTLNSGITIVTNGYRIFANGTFTNNGTIQWNGADASGSTAAAALGNTSGSVNTSSFTGGAGGNGGTTTGSTGGAQSNSFGGASGAGGAGSSGGGGGSRNAGRPAASVGSIRALPAAVTNFLSNGTGTTNTSVISFGGAGGSGGGGDSANAGGGGGAGGGIVILAVYQFAGTGAIQARGGAGGNQAAGTAGGGGGGGGGWVSVISNSVSAGAITGQTIDANGGTFGTGVHANGNAGSSGTVVLLAN